VHATLRVRRWRRYGADRAFVVDSCGAHLGSVDLASGKVDSVEPCHDHQVRRAVQEYLRTDADEVVIAHHRSPLEGFTLADEQILRGWLDTPIMLGGPAPGCLSVRTQLEQLRDTGWTVAHHVPLGLQGSTCPHVLVGPSGVFTVRRIGRVGAQVEVDGAVLLIDGTPVTTLRDAVFECRRIRSLLVGCVPSRVQVRPVLAVTGDLVTTGEPGRTLVLAAQDVGGALRRLDRTLGPFEQLALARQVRHQGWGRVWGG